MSSAIEERSTHTEHISACTQEADLHVYIAVGSCQL